LEVKNLVDKKGGLTAVCIMHIEYGTQTRDNEYETMTKSSAHLAVLLVQYIHHIIHTFEQRSVFIDNWHYPAIELSGLVYDIFDETFIRFFLEKQQRKLKSSPCSFVRAFAL
jgi:hypothetical protein